MQRMMKTKEKKRKTMEKKTIKHHHCHHNDAASSSLSSSHICQSSSPTGLSYRRSLTWPWRNLSPSFLSRSLSPPFSSLLLFFLFRSFRAPPLCCLSSSPAGAGVIHIACQTDMLIHACMHALQSSVSSYTSLNCGQRAPSVQTCPDRPV